MNAIHCERRRWRGGNRPAFVSNLLRQFRFHDFLLKAGVVLLDETDNGKAGAVSHVEGGPALLLVDQEPFAELLEQGFEVFRDVKTGDGKVFCRRWKK
jgi:hypothetical protein